MSDWCILINTTPKYLPLVEVQLICLRRYSPELDSIPVFIATEILPSESCLQRILQIPSVHYLSLKKDDADFLESRIAAVEYLSFFKFILPLQEDFWLDRSPDYIQLFDGLNILRKDSRVQSIRLMPCPGPNSKDVFYRNSTLWKVLSSHDTYRFTFQATIWRPDIYTSYLKEICQEGKVEYDALKDPTLSWSAFCVRHNIAENSKGQQYFLSNYMNSDKYHLSIDRPMSHPNAVYLAPWPYRPTAVVKGILEPWAKEFAIREGFKKLEGWY
jgi:hypothetical protein